MSKLMTYCLLVIATYVCVIIPLKSNETNTGGGGSSGGTGSSRSWDDDTETETDTSEKTHGGSGGKIETGSSGQLKYRIGQSLEENKKIVESGGSDWNITGYTH